MGLFTPREEHDEDSGLDAVGLTVALDELACPTCRRALRPWEAACPDDGAVAVPRTALAPVSRPPAHLLDPPDDGPGDGPDDGLAGGR